MSLTGLSYMGLDTHTPNGRLAAYLRSQFPREHATKRLASEIGCTPKAAENILAAHWPCARHWSAIARRFGRDVLEATFGDDIDTTTARLAGELRDLEQQAEHRRAMLRQAEGRMARGQGGVGPAEGQAAVGRRGRR
jgi:hypothetical protein